MRVRFGEEAVSSKERRVWEQVATGRSNAEIGQTLFVASETVKFHLTSLFIKLGVKNRTELALLWYERHAGTWLCCGQSIYTPFCPWCGAART